MVMYASTPPSYPQFTTDTTLHKILARSLAKVDCTKKELRKNVWSPSALRSSEQLTGAPPSSFMPSRSNSAQKPQPGFGRAAKIWLSSYMEAPAFRLMVPGKTTQLASSAREQSTALLVQFIPLNLILSHPSGRSGKCMVYNPNANASKEASTVLKITSPT